MNFKIKNLIDKNFKKGIKKYNEKNYLSAIDTFKEILKFDEKDIKTNHALGVSYGALGDHNNAIVFLEKALTINSNYIPSLTNIAVSYYEIKEFDKAINVYQKLLFENNQKNPALYTNLANCYYNKSDYQEAEKYYDMSLHINPNQFEPYLNLSIIAKKLKKYELSLEIVSKAETFAPNNYFILKHIADLHFKRKDFHGSAIYSQKLLDQFPDDLDGLFSLVCSKFELQEDLVAKRLMSELIEKTKDYQQKERFYKKLCEVIININSWDSDKDYSLLMEYSEEAIKLNPKNYSTLSYRAIAKYYSNDRPGAVIDAEKAKEMNPTALITLSNLSNFYKLTGNYEKAVATLEEFFQVFPDDRSQDFLYSTICFSLSRFDRAWKYYEGRWDPKKGGRDKIKPQFIKPEWTPELGYKSILIWAEQGLGDQILHGTIIDDFSKKFEKTYLSVDPRLVQIFKKSFPHITVLSLFDSIGQDFFDYQICLTSIGQYSRTKLDDFYPLKTHYNIPQITKANDNKRLKCAISWKSASGMHSKLKSSSLNSLRKILELNQIDFFNIQYTNEKEEVDKFKNEYGIEILDPPNLDVKNDLEGLVKFIHSCDFVLTTSNTNAHLAGAIGKKTYLLLPTAAGRIWYWENYYQGKNIWYPSIEKFLQTNSYDWTDPVELAYEKILKDYDL